MLDNQFKLEVKIGNSSMFNSQNKNFGSLKANLTLKVKVTNFQNCMRH